MERFLISPPFGNYLSFPGTIRVRGTFTYEPRGSWPYKMWRMLKTVRPIPGGWRNSIGFQNPGIRSIRTFDPNAIYSIGAVADGEWEKLLDAIPPPVKLEINMGCPNLKEHPELSATCVQAFIAKYPLVIFKLTYSPDTSAEISFLVENGATYLHLFNTIPTVRGGESGKRVQEVALKTIRETKAKYPHVKVVGGGGIYSLEDKERYRESGADYYSLSSLFLNPLQASRLLKQI